MTEGGAIEVLSSRVLLAPVDFDRSLRFYGTTLGLHIFREFGYGASRGVVFFLGGGFLELSGCHAPSRKGALRENGQISLWLQLPDVDDAFARLRAEVEVVEPPIDKPWGLREARIKDPDGVLLVLVQVPDTHPLRRGA